MRVFVDESGHSGEEIFDLAQPIYTCALAWVPAELESHLLEILARARRDHRIQMPELKGSRLIKSAPGRRALLQIGQGCIDAGIGISFVAQHKPFMAAAAVIEDCTDHVYNPSFPSDWLLDATRKEPAAQFLHDMVPQDVLLNWWRARSRGELEAWRAAHERLVRLLSLIPDAGAFAQALSRFDLVGRFESINNPHSLPGSRLSPNSTTFPVVLVGIEQQAEYRGLNDVRIVHDEQTEFESAYHLDLELARDPERFVRYDGANGVSDQPIERIAGITFASSSIEPALQVADCMATVARKALQAGISPRDQSQGLPNTFRGLLRAIYTRRLGPGFPFVVGPIEWQRPAMAVLMGDDL